jgi:hypothetical protein
LHSNEDDAGSFVHRIFVSGRSQKSGAPVPLEDADLVGELLGYDEEVAAGSEGKVAGLFAAERGTARKRQLARRPDCIDQQLLRGTAVASVEKASSLVEDDLARAILGDVGAGQQGGGVGYGGENASLRR